MGMKQSCCICGTGKDDVDNPLLHIHHSGKRNGQYVCLSCIKKKIKCRERYEQRIKIIPEYVNEFALE